MGKRRNAATPQRRNAATPQRRNAATPQTARKGICPLGWAEIGRLGRQLIADCGSTRRRKDTEQTPSCRRTRVLLDEMEQLVPWAELLLEVRSSPCFTLSHLWMVRGRLLQATQG